HLRDLHSFPTRRSSDLAMALHLSWRVSLLVGFLVALSSTAIVLKGLTDKGEIDAPHGRLASGVLIFQDLCVVPMMLVLPFLAGPPGEEREDEHHGYDAQVLEDQHSGSEAAVGCIDLALIGESLEDDGGA